MSDELMVRRRSGANSDVDGVLKASEHAPADEGKEHSEKSGVMKCEK